MPNFSATVKAYLYSHFYLGAKDCEQFEISSIWLQLAMIVSYGLFFLAVLAKSVSNKQLYNCQN